jgi:hypothetical protein
MRFRAAAIVRLLRRNSADIEDNGLMNARSEKRIMINAMIVVWLLLISYRPIGAQGAEEDSLEVVAEGQYEAPVGTAKNLARQIALFEAKKKAVESAGRYLAGKHLVLSYEQKKEEIYCLVASKIRSKVIAEETKPAGDAYIYHIGIRATVRSSDYIEADILDKQMEIEEAREPLKAELEPPITDKIQPGVDISQAYRLLRNEKLRPAMIYLDRLEKKYPNWAAIYMAKAMGFYLLSEPANMQRELIRACTAGNANACDDLKSLKRVREFDLDAETSKSNP